jgi:predicted NBD/HSP70 family sugar kinase
MPAEGIVEVLRDQVKAAAGRQGDIAAVGVGVPGLVRNGVVEEAPNLPQLKGARMADMLSAALRADGVQAPVTIINDADAFAAGIAATTGKLDAVVRVWTLGVGIGYGRYPATDGVWEGGHTVVTLDDKENYCGCGGRGHLEGIMGHRAMRLRFMDLEPEEVFSQAEAGEARCVEFVKLWHRALAAATATSIHLDGPGKFFITGFNARFLNLTLLNEYLHEMVKLSPLQGYSAEVVPGGESVAAIGAAVNASQVARTAGG